MVFRGERGAMLRRGNFGRATKWPETVVKAGLPAGFHFHDLRHTGNLLAANSGATTRELMHRMGHGSIQAALIYQHASTERDRRIAQEMATMVERERRTTEDHDEAPMPTPTPANRTEPRGAHLHDRGWAPFLLVDRVERATGIEPA
ncbi:tyrosine-type recombinase/integrase [Pseudonocardia sp. CA-142604]|uniref:tyrosine-type recombinase/integrase n=1 Tax=Pseudonocardia sp. CA-142604 TaxID=3240024 RepID=UPI003D948CDA